MYLGRRSRTATAAFVLWSARNVFWDAFWPDSELAFMDISSLCREQAASVVNINSVEDTLWYYQKYGTFRCRIIVICSSLSLCPAGKRNDHELMVMRKGEQKQHIYCSTRRRRAGKDLPTT